MKTFIVILRWIARIISIAPILLFSLMFVQDGLPFFLFANDAPELAFHMWALLGMLISLGLGWKWEGLSALLTLLFFIADEIALLVYGLRTIGLPAGFEIPLYAISFPFILFPLGGLFYLISWAWEKHIGKTEDYGNI